MSHSHHQPNKRILVIDDNRAIHDDIRKILIKSTSEETKDKDAMFEDEKSLLFGESAPKVEATSFEIDSAYQGEDGLKLVQAAAASGRPYGVAFVDVRMPPGWDGVETITQIWRQHPDIQIVICTAYSDYSWEEMIHELGRTDSLVVLKKPFDSIEVQQLAHALSEKWTLHNELETKLHDLDDLVIKRTGELEQSNTDLLREIDERKQVEQALRHSEERFAKAFSASPIPLSIQSQRDLRYVDVNSRFAALTGYPRESLIGFTPAQLGLWQSDHSSEEQHEQGKRHPHDQARVLSTQSGEKRTVLISIEEFEMEGENFILASTQDITAQLELEDRLRQRQRLEVVGQLAGGVAHDFNNILTSMMLNLEFMRVTNREPEQQSPLNDLHAMMKRAAKITSQLLMFARKQFVDRQRFELNSAIGDLLNLLNRTLGEHIELRSEPSPGSLWINADTNMLDQAVMNLCLNARDAMPEGGTLTISTAAVQITHARPATVSEARPGSFACITISDTGTGMSAGTLQHIFEPFFTTKDIGHGTGLGLASVHGTVHQHEGWIDVDSTEGKGSSFALYLPLLPRIPPRAPTAASAVDTMPRGDETILLVEDEESVRRVTTILLQRLGYTVLTANNGHEALRVFAENKESIDLVFTDIVMPDGLSGIQLEERIRHQNPAMKVVLSSGYSDEIIKQQDRQGTKTVFLAKPFEARTVAHALRKCLDQK
ncbi:hybrid sensor histidine kinase/response regulator [Synoicihabitans lomoniglobus]|uniref:histidine kinase n=1 Tax=Synoicihabitans lomoniglobus TaxID=2909285 RepID=A0AAE9ZSB1_9BACT|nr:response regulator [Opitutaceae bacterium LMO-M01]WED63267.1 response regulator [Opitutaceae bacterium LMO-M01]